MCLIHVYLINSLSVQSFETAAGILNRFINEIERLERAPTRETAAQFLIQLAARLYARLPARLESFRQCTWQNFWDMINNDYRVINTNSKRRYFILPRSKTRVCAYLRCFVKEDEVNWLS